MALRDPTSEKARIYVVVCKTILFQCLEHCNKWAMTKKLYLLISRNKPTKTSSQKRLLQGVGTAKSFQMLG